MDLGTPPQKLRLMLSSGDATVQVVDVRCKECCHKRRYDAALSSSAGKCTSDRDVKACVDKMEVFGTTTNEFTFIDWMDIGEYSPFAKQAFDGYATLRSKNFVSSRVFGFYMTRTCAKNGDFTTAENEAGTITLGGVDSTHCGNPNPYLSLNLSNARLTTPLDSASVGSASLSDAWRAEFDPSSSEILVPKDIFDALNKAIGAYMQNYGTWLVDCTAGSGLNIELKFSGQTQSIPFSQVVYQTGNRCVMRLRPRTDGYTDLWSIGLPLMRQYCMLFDFETNRLAFAATKATPIAQCVYPPKEGKYTTPCDAKEQSSSSTSTPNGGSSTGNPPQSATSGSNHLASLAFSVFILSALFLLM
ncbi:lysosomal aspartic protease-like protein [Aphelenchoides avenae]|nr:lysosomal aspartic protease-like protein [Aphelenchus avenae]